MPAKHHRKNGQRAKEKSASHRGLRQQEQQAQEAASPAAAAGGGDGGGGSSQASAAGGTAQLNPQPQARAGGAGAHQVPLKNAMLERFYTLQRIVPGDPAGQEWDLFLGACRTPLPVCFRVLPGPGAARLQQLQRRE
eukprot:SAG22_NODE_10096_length_553_cov_0.991189_1_plen_136_part_01